MPKESRVINSVKNISWGYIGLMLNLLLSFASRTVFIQMLGAAYLGVNGLFTNVLNILSFTELGIGVAMNFSLYKPVAERDQDKIRSLMQVYRQAYYAIAGIVTVLGLALLPFLDVFVKGGEGLGDLRVYYLLFLFNTVSTYFVSYKYGLVNAEQKNYILTNLDTISRVVITIAQIVVLLVFQDFLAYLLVQTGFQLLQKIGTAIYLNRRYAFLGEKEAKTLDRETKTTLITNIKALIVHKFGEICVYQTDNIVISTFVNITTVGLVSNYNIIIDACNRLITVVMTGVVSSIGNLIATESQEKQYRVFLAYDLVGFWLYSVECIGLVILSQPFITIWIGSEYQIDNLTLGLILFNTYFVGQRAAAFQFQTASGLFNPGKWASLVQSGVNLVVSIYGVIHWGLPGVFIGTIVSGIVISVWKPYILYKYAFQRSSVSYFIRLGRNFLITLGVIFLLEIVKTHIWQNQSVKEFLVLLVITVILPNLLYSIIFWRTDAFQFIFCKVKTLRGRRG